MRSAVATPSRVVSPTVVTLSDAVPNISVDGSRVNDPFWRFELAQPVVFDSKPPLVTRFVVGAQTPSVGSDAGRPSPPSAAARTAAVTAGPLTVTAAGPLSSETLVGLAATQTKVGESGTLGPHATE